jgi:hypothetical protein
MFLPEDYWCLPPDELDQLAVNSIEQNGVFWLPITRTPSRLICSTIEKLMDDRRLCLHSPKPDWDHVIIDIDRLPDWHSWIEKHAYTRSYLREGGVPDHKLPPLPEGIWPEEI